MGSTDTKPGQHTAPVVDNKVPCTVYLQPGSVTDGVFKPHGDEQAVTVRHADQRAGMLIASDRAARLAGAFAARIGACRVRFQLDGEAGQRAYTMVRLDG